MSTVILDTITGKSTATTITIGSTPVVSASANSMTISGEGSAQTSIQQGLAKVWVNYTGITTTATRDSFNVASLTDVGTGKTNVVYTTAMANVNYSGSYYTNANAGTADYNFNNDYVGAFGIGSNGRTTALVQLGAYDAGNIDSSHNDVVIMGDLA